MLWNAFSDKFRRALLYTLLWSLCAFGADTLHLGVDDSFYPLNYRGSDGKLKGLNVDLIQAVSQKSGIPIKLHGGAWSEVLHRAMEHELDGIVNADVTEERKTRLSFTEPYAHHPMTVYTHASARSQIDIKGFYGKRIGVKQNTSLFRYLTTKHPKIQIQPLKSHQEGLLQLVAGALDGVADWYAVLNSSVENLMLKDLKPNLVFLSEEVGHARLALKHDLADKIPRLEEGINQIEEPRRQELTRKWLQLSELTDTTNFFARLTAEEISFLETLDTLQVGYSKTFAPIAFQDKSGEPTGIARDYLSYLESMTGLTFQYNLEMPWNAQQDALRRKQLDMLTTVSYTPERDEFMDMTNPYIDLPIRIFTKKSVQFLHSLDALKQKRVAIIRGSALESWVRRDHGAINMVLVRNTEEGIKLLEQEDVDAYVGNVVVASRRIEEQGITSIRISGETPYSYKLRMGVREDYAPLVGIFNKAFRVIPETDKKTIFNKWVGVQFEIVRDYKAVYQSLALFIVATILFILWIRKLSKENERRRRIEYELQEQKQQVEEVNKRLVMATENTGVGIWDWDMDQGIIEGNKIWMEILGSDGALPQEDMNDRMHPEDLQEYQNRFAKHLRGEEEKLDIVIRYRHPEKNWIWLHSVGKFVNFNSDSGKPTRMLGTLVNDTRRKYYELELEEAREQAEKASRAKSEFLANMSHEIRTPMNGIVGLGNLLAKTHLERKQKGYLEKIQSSADSLLHIINDILDLSKVEAGKMDIEHQSFTIRKELEQALVGLQVRAEEKGLDLRVNVDPAVPIYLVSDHLRVRQVLINLVGNAIKFTEDGAIHIQVEFEEKSDEEGILSVQVQDTGIGIKPEKLDSLFQPFVQEDTTTSRQYGGTGLGLAISKSLVEKMGGEISVQSMEGYGSIFKFTILCGIGMGDEIQPAPSVKVPLKGLHVLLVEDHPLNQMVAREILQGQGVEVAVAVNGVRALEYIDSQKPDLVLMDVQMPVMNGLEATRHLRKKERFQDLPILAMTANALEKDRDECLDAGMNGFVSKPFKEQDLFEEILKVLPDSVQEKLQRLDQESAFLEEAQKQSAMKLPNGNPNGNSVGDSKGGPERTPNTIVLEDATEGLPAQSTLEEGTAPANLEEARSRLGISDKAFQRFVLTFAESYEQFATEVRDLFEKQGWENLEILMHTLKSTAGNLGAVELQEEAASVEKRCQQWKEEKESGNHPNANFSEFTLIIDLLVHTRDYVLANYREEDSNEEAAPEMDEAAKLQFLADIEQRCQKHRVVSLQDLDTLTGIFQGSAGEALARSVKADIENLRFLDALTKLVDLRTYL